MILNMDFTLIFCYNIDGKRERDDTINERY